MAKYSYEQKLQVVLDVVENHLSHTKAASKIGASKGDSQKWVGLYHKFGVEGLTIKHGSYDGQFKIEVVEYMHKHQLSLRETAAKFGIPSRSTVTAWERIYYEQGLEALLRDNREGKKINKKNKPLKTKLDQKVPEDLIAEVGRLRMENAYLKKLNALVQERIQQEFWKK